jgi:hypothetical protein
VRRKSPAISAISSAKGAALSQPRATPQEKRHQRNRGLKARHIEICSRQFFSMASA